MLDELGRYQLALISHLTDEEWQSYVDSGRFEQWYQAVLQADVGCIVPRKVALFLARYAPLLLITADWDEHRVALVALLDLALPGAQYRAC